MAGCLRMKYWCPPAPGACDHSSTLPAGPTCEPWRHRSRFFDVSAATFACLWWKCETVPDPQHLCHKEWHEERNLWIAHGQPDYCPWLMEKTTEVNRRVESDADMVIFLQVPNGHNYVPYLLCHVYSCKGHAGPPGGWWRHFLASGEASATWRWRWYVVRTFSLFIYEYLFGLFYALFLSTV